MDAVAITLLEFAAWGGLCAGVLFLWSAAWGRWAVVVQAVLVVACSLVLLPGFASRGDSRRVELGSWLQIDSVPDASIGLSHAIDAVSLAVLAAVSFAALFVAVRREERPPPDEVRRLPALFVVYQAALQFTLAGNLVVQLACWQLAAVGLFAGQTNDRNRPAEQSKLLLRLIADGLILLALVVIAGAFGTTGIPLAGDSVESYRAGWFGPFTSREAAGLLLLSGVLIRGVSVVLTDERREPTTGDFVPLDAAIAALGALLLFRAGSYIGEPVVRNATLIAGGAVAAVAGGFAAFGPRRPSPASAVFLGTMLAGLGVGTQTGARGAVLLLVAFAALSGGARSASRWLRFGSVVWLISGLAGQAAVLAGLFEALEPVAESGAAFPAMAAIVLLACGHAGASFALTCALRRDAARESWPGMGPGAEVAVGVAGLAFVVALSTAFTADLFAAAAVATVGGIAGTAGWLVGGSQCGAPRVEPGPPMLPRWLLLPISVPAAVCRLLERGLEAVCSLPGRLPGALQSAAEPLQSASVRRHVVSLLLAAGLLVLLAVGWGGGR